MSDQANKLRELAFTATATSSDVGAQLPMVIVTGAKAGVGATAVAVNLSAALADRGERVLTVDAAQHRNDLGDVADIGREFEFSLGDVMAGRCEASQAVVAGAAGMRIVASRGRVSSKLEIASRRDAAACDYSRSAQQRLFAGLESLRGEIDVAVVETGYGLTAWSRRFWTQARLVVLVTTTDDASILAAYTALKLSATDGICPPLRVLVNRADGDREADDALRRIEASCQRFLSLSVEALPALPCHEDESGAVQRRAPRVWEAPHSAFGHAVLWMGRDVGELLKGQQANNACDGATVPARAA